jgi:hypothetical protein
MGVSKRVCAANKDEMRSLKAKAKRILSLKEKYPQQSMDRILSLTVKLNEIMERVEYLKRNKNSSSAYDFTYVYKKERVKNRKLPKK